MCVIKLRDIQKQQDAGPRGPELDTPALIEVIHFVNIKDKKQQNTAFQNRLPLTGTIMRTKHDLSDD